MNWTTQQEIIVKIENRFIPQISRILNRVYRDGLAMYQAGTWHQLTNTFFDDELFKLLMQMYTKSGVTMARYVYKTMPTVKQLESKATGRMGVSAQWLQAVKAYLAKYALQFVTDIMGTVREDMIDLFQKAENEGWSYEYLATKLLREGLAKRRARVIARTEVHRGAMAGSVQGANTLEYVVQKEWLSGHDNRVRRVPRDKYDHRKLNGEVKEMHEPFVNQEPIMFPGDPEASKGNTIQCRCVLNYIPKRDEKGRLILKKP